MSPDSSVEAILDEVIEMLRQRHLARMPELLPIGAALDAQQLVNWIAIGRRMAAQGKGFMA